MEEKRKKDLTKQFTKHLDSHESKCYWPSVIVLTLTSITVTNFNLDIYLTKTIIINHHFEQFLTKNTQMTIQKKKDKAIRSHIQEMKDNVSPFLSE